MNILVVSPQICYVEVFWYNRTLIYQQIHPVSSYYVKSGFQCICFVSLYKKIYILKFCYIMLKQIDFTISCEAYKIVTKWHHKMRQQATLALLAWTMFNHRSTSFVR